MRMRTVGLCWALGASVVLAQGRAELSADDLVSDIGVARLADEAGSAALAAMLATQKAGRLSSLAAARAAPFAATPEGLIAPLVALACGRDPVLAPEAGAALLRMSEQFVPSRLAAREVLLIDLRQARASLEHAGGCAAPRSDIANALATLSAQLDSVLATMPSASDRGGP